MNAFLNQAFPSQLHYMYIALAWRGIHPKRSLVFAATPHTIYEDLEFITALCSGANHYCNFVGAIYACVVCSCHYLSNMLLFRQSNSVSAIYAYVFLLLAATYPYSQARNQGGAQGGEAPQESFSPPWKNMLNIV